MEVPFFLLTSSLHLVRLHFIELQFDQVENFSTNPLDVSLTPFHTGATIVESSACLQRVGVEP